MMISKCLSSFLFYALITTSAISGQEQCPPDGVSYIPDLDCSKYYICADGESIPQTCPVGFYFNPNIHECDYPINVPECVGGTRPPIVEPTEPISTTRPTSAITSTSTQQSGPTTPIPEPTESEPTSSSASTDPVISSTGRPDPTMRNCGETVVAGDYGLIEYKLDQLYTDGERCAFIIRSFVHSGFLFTLETHGIVEDPTLQGAAINIFGFGSNGLQDTVHLGPPNPLNTSYVQGSMVVVVFKSETLRGEGLRLRYEGVGEPTRSVGFWDDLTFSEVPGSVKYPLTGSSYSSNTSSLFIVSNNNRRIPSLYDTLHLGISQIDLDVCDDGCNCDYVQVYALDSEALLDDLQRVCQVQDIREFDTRGLFVVFFKTDGSKEKSGFTMDWRIQENVK